MRLLRFACPPLPHYINGGQNTYALGDQHAERRNIQVFDLIIVTNGCLMMIENNRPYNVSAGQSLILRPNGHHRSSERCGERTHFYWLHFQTRGTWTERDLIKEGTDDSNKKANLKEQDDEDIEDVYYHGTRIDISYRDIRTFNLQIPKHCTLTPHGMIYERMTNLIELDTSSKSTSRFKQQHLFQEILETLSMHGEDLNFSPAARSVAQDAATFIRQNYTQSIYYEDLRRQLQFHPTYIARCMQQVFGCTPAEYLIGYRIDQAKLLLLRTNYSIEKISETVGFNHSSYFTRCFSKHEGVSPRAYRKSFDAK